MSTDSIAESHKTGWGSRAANVLCVLVILAVLAINGADLWGYLSNPGRYPIGAEMAGILYSSRIAFLLLTGGFSLLCGFGLLVPVWTKKPRTRLLIRAVVAFVVVLGMAYLASTVER